MNSFLLANKGRRQQERLTEEGLGIEHCACQLQYVQIDVALTSTERGRQVSRRVQNVYRR